MFCSQCGAPMGDNDKFCGVCGAPNAGAAGPAPQGQPQPQQFVPQPPVANAPKGCVVQAFQDMTKTPGVLQRVCQIAFLPALICAVSVLVLFIPYWRHCGCHRLFGSLHCERVRFRLWHRVGSRSVA